MGLERSIVDSVYNFDFTATKGIGIRPYRGRHAFRRKVTLGDVRAIAGLAVPLVNFALLLVDLSTSTSSRLQLDH